jgi:hypothetical protein
VVRGSRLPWKNVILVEANNRIPILIMPDKNNQDPKGNRQNERVAPGGENPVPGVSQLRSRRQTQSSPELPFLYNN